MKINQGVDVLEGTRDELIVVLRKRKLKYREIAALVGCSRTTVGNVLAAAGLTGRLLYAELMDPTTFRSSDDAQIASKLNVPEAKVKRARRVWMGALEEPGIVSLSTRRTFLTQFLFGKDPGPKFGDWLTERLEPSYIPYLLGRKQANLIRHFYLSGTGSNDNYSRYYRYYARQMMVRRLKGISVEELVKAEVLVG